MHFRALVILLVLNLMGCSTLSGRSNFKESTLANLNPAPETMAPPSVTKDGQIDSTYMQNLADYHFTLGEAYALDYKHERAVEEFKSALLYDPESLVVRQRLAGEYVNLGLHNEALEQAELIVKKDPTSEEGRLLLARLYTTLKMYDQALEQYKYVAEHHPDNKVAPVFIGAILADQERFDEAIAFYKKVIADPKHAEYKANFHLYIGQIYVERGKDFLPKAEGEFTEALRLKPDDVDVVSALAKVYQARGKESQAMKLLESFQDKFGPDRRVSATLSKIYLESEEYEKAYRQLENLEGFDDKNLNIKFRMALLLIEMKKYRAAVERLEDILTKSPELDKIRFYLGAVYEELNDKPMAIRHFSQISSASTYYTEATVHTAYIQKQTGDYDSAVKVVVEAIKKRPDTAQFYAFYASLLDEKRDYNTAVSMLMSAVEKFPNNTQLRFFLGSMHDRRGETDKTITDMKKVLEQDESHVQALNYLAYTYADNNMHLDDALKLSMKALELQPDDGYILDTVGWVHFKLGQFENAIRFLEAAYRNKTDESIIAEHLGDAYYKAQMNEKARAMYRKAISIEKDVNKVQKIREKLAAVDIQNSERRPASTGSGVSK